MKFLIDQALSDVVASGLCNAGHDAVHLRDYGMSRSPDTEVLAKAVEENRVLVSADTDFGELLAKSKDSKPSVVLFRGILNRHPDRQVELILKYLPDISAALEQGYFVVLNNELIKTRPLPIKRSGKQKKKK